MTPQPSHVIHAAAGRPSRVTSARGRCRACGVEGRGEPFQDWVRPTFVDFDSLSPGEIICEPCQFCFNDGSPELQAKLGKDKPQRMRNYSHFVIGDEWHALSKGEKPAMRELLRRSPSIAVIALSGQKHTIFRARSGWWQVEETAIRPDVDTLEESVEIAESLLDLGFSKAEIDSGRYSHGRIWRTGSVETWRELENRAARLRGSHYFELGVWLSQKQAGETNHADGPTDRGEDPTPDLERDRPGLQASLFD